jgi:hypothetical protein
VNDRSGCTLSKYGRHELMAIESIASERHKQITAANRSRIRTDLSYAPLPRYGVLARENFYADDFSQLLDRKESHRFLILRDPDSGLDFHAQSRNC